MTEGLFDTIESPRFSAAVNVVSSYKAFLKALANAPELRQLHEEMRHWESIGAVFSRLVEVSEREIDPGRENPWDVALAAYLWLLWLVEKELAEIGASIVLSTPNCWWAGQLAQAIDAPRSSSGAGTLLWFASEILSPVQVSRQTPQGAFTVVSLLAHKTRTIEGLHPRSRGYGYVGEEGENRLSYASKHSGSGRRKELVIGVA
jgi:hypothetical protein